MKVIKFIVVGFYMVFVIPMCTIMVASLAYGAVVETIKIIKKNQ
jgi:hypothetical protein